MSEQLVEPPAVWADRRSRTGVAAPRLAHRHVLHRRAPEAAARPQRARHPGDPADPLARHLRHDLQPDPGDPHGRHRPTSTSWRPASSPSRPCSSSIFYGIQIIWERDAGVLTKLLVTPTPRAALVAGKAFAAGVRSVAQAVIVVVVAALMGVAMTWNPVRLIGRGRRRHARRRVLLLPVAEHRRCRPQARPADGDRPGDHDAALLRLERALPDRRSCRAGSRSSAMSTR